VRDAIEEHHPAVFVASLPFSRVGHVNDLIAGEALRRSQCARLQAGLVREDAARGSRRIFEVAQREEQNGADENPPSVDRQPASGASHHAAIIRIVTRDEIEQKLIAIVRQEKHIPDDLLTPQTALADAGIDSLDSLTILFAVEEQFGISIPDDRARAMRTFSDLVDIVQDLLPRT